MVDRVVLRAATRPELERHPAETQGGDLGDEALVVRCQLVHHRRGRQRFGCGIATLGLDPPAERRERRAVVQHLFSTPSPLLGVDPEVGERQEPAGRLHGEREEIGRSVFACEHSSDFVDLERVADRPAERLVHIGQEADDFSSGSTTELEHRLGEHARVGE